MDQYRERVFAFLVVITVCVVLSVYWVFTLSMHKSNRHLLIFNKINPDTAPIGSLIRLPGIGLTRARAIVAYRNKFHKNHAGKCAFKCSADLCMVGGLGFKTVKEFSGFLVFSTR